MPVGEMKESKKERKKDMPSYMLMVIFLNTETLNIKNHVIFAPKNVPLHLLLGYDSDASKLKEHCMSFTLDPLGNYFKQATLTYSNCMNWQLSKLLVDYYCNV